MDRYRRPDQHDGRSSGYGWQARGEMSQGRGRTIGDNRWNGAGGYSDSSIVRRDEVYGGRTDSDGAITSARGKGPKNFTRSDERIREDVCERLEDADVDAGNIEVSVQSGEVVLDGFVPDRVAKHQAEDIVWTARGVKDVQNRLRIGAEVPSATSAPAPRSGATGARPPQSRRSR